MSLRRKIQLVSGENDENLCERIPFYLESKRIISIETVGKVAFPARETIRLLKLRVVTYDPNMDYRKILTCS